MLRWICFVLFALASKGNAQVQSFAFPPPLQPKPLSEQFYGVTVDDPWRYLEDVKDPKVAEWMKEQAETTRKILHKIPGRGQLLSRIAAIDAAASGQVGAIKKTELGQLFFTRREPNENQFKLVLREPSSSNDIVLVDVEERSRKAGRPLAILDFSPSFDGRYLTYTLQVAGSEIGELHLMDVRTQQELTTPIDRIRFAGVNWVRDGRGFFFSRLREGYQSMPDTEKFGDRTTWYFDMSRLDTRVVFSPIRNAELKLPLFASAEISEVPGTGLVALHVGLGVDRNRQLYLADRDSAINGKARWRKLFDVADQVRSYAVTQRWVYLLSAKQAPRHRLLRMPLSETSISNAEVLIPDSQEVLVSLAGARDGAYVVKRNGPSMQLLRIEHNDPIPRSMPLEFDGTVGLITADPSQDGVIYGLTGWTRALRHFMIDSSLSPRPLQLARTGAYDQPSDLIAKELTVRGKDGAPIPISIISRSDIKLNGNNPTILYGYGSYGITENPFFNPRLLAYLEQGAVFVYAHVRGGGIYGTEWHVAGQKSNKANTWRDGIAVAEWLIEQGYTSSKHLGIFGGSAGGIFVGMAINERPDLFVAAVPAVPVMDMVRYELDPNGLANVPEFGTVKTKEGFQSLYAMSSYHQAKPADYPAVMLVHGVNDTRVSVWQTTKYANRIMHNSKSGKPVLMRLDYQLGHGGGASRLQQQEQTADIWSFMFWQMGLPNFQPN